MVVQRVALHTIIEEKHLCVTLVLIVRTDFIWCAGRDQLIRGADDSRIFLSVTAFRLEIVHRAALARTCLCIIAVFEVCTPNTIQA